MNKSERDKLANIVSTMIYDFSTTPQLVDVGRLILSEFPAIQEDLKFYRYITALANVTNSIISALCDKNNISVFDSKIAILKANTASNVGSIFETYLENIDVPDAEAYLFHLEENISQADLHNIFTEISDLINSDVWHCSVAHVYEPGTDEYNYLINNLTEGAENVD
jgi:hypothetical protein